MLIERVSPLSGSHTMDLPVTEAQLQAYQSGALIQVAFPNLNTAEREFIKTGFTEEDWEVMFAGEEM